MWQISIIVGIITEKSWKHCGYKGEIVRFNPFPHIDAFWRLCSRKLFWKHSDKRRNCSKRAISPFDTMFSTFSHRLSIQLKRFSMFWQNMFKVVCCRIVVWGKGLSNFSFCHDVFKSLLLQMSQNASTGGKGLKGASCLVRMFCGVLVQETTIIVHGY